MTYLQQSLPAERRQTIEQNALGHSITESSLIDQCQQCGDWESRYRVIMQLAKQLPPMPSELCCESNQIHGCESQVWLTIYSQDQRYYFIATSNARIVKGLLAALIAAWQGQNGDFIQQFDANHYFHQLGLSKHLSPSRSNGLAAIVATAKQHCLKS
ncbi:Sulfur acceptor protein CsdE [Sinobacterium norvegicum]|uniref:Sulfur acceptor protein CsdE n=1 Tax=Sinobacterium norvegicum TaxID=1641715 RepID=A0ABN8EEM2_9GAMM|nr:SufE family protein [Sinobacterium norvegicum]CAH0990869.1 Sulfur acceptor protein CsdE [Sinobacterium norvegicum]